MLVEALLTLSVLGLMLAAMVREWTTPSVAVLGAVVCLLVSGVLTTEEAFAGFSNAAPITVAALWILGHAVHRTGALRPLVGWALAPSTGERSQLARLLVPAALASAFINNTPIVAMLVPQVVPAAERCGTSASRLLMPLSFAVVLGGVITTVGTSTNLVVSGLLRQQGGVELGLLDMTHVGLPVAIAGVAMLIVLAPRLLPDRSVPGRTLAGAPKEFVARMRVVPGSDLDGVTVESAGLRHLQGVFLAEIERAGEVVAPVAPTAVLQGGDLLVFVGRAELVVDLQARDSLVSAEGEHISDLVQAPGFFEAVVGSGSPLVGVTAKEVGFRGYYQAAIVAIHRDGQRVAGKLGEIPLRHGDTLLLLGDEDFAERWWGRPDFLMIAPAGEEPSTPPRKARIVLATLAATMIAAGSGLLPILHAALVGVGVLLATRVLSVEDARRAVSLEVIVLIAASFGLGTAVERSGLADILAQALTASTSGLGWRGALLGIVLATLALTELISNNAAAALMFPIAVTTAASVGVEPERFAIAMAVAASASFLTPTGYQTNTMVFGPGGYRFGDYARLGAPLTGVVVLVIMATA